MGKILDMMSRRSARAFDAFVEALVMTDQEHVAEVLDRDLTRDLVQRRNAERGMNSQPISQPLSPSSHSAVVPSGAAVTTSSSTANVSSFHTNPAPTPTPGMYLLMQPFCHRSLDDRNNIIRPVKNLPPYTCTFEGPNLTCSNL